MDNNDSTTCGVIVCFHDTAGVMTNLNGLDMHGIDGLELIGGDNI